MTMPAEALSERRVPRTPTGALRCVGVALASQEPQQLARFYTEALKFTKVAESGDDVHLKLGDCQLRLQRARGRAMPEDSRSHDRWFRHLAIVVRDMPRAVRQLERFSTRRVSPQPETLPAWNKTSGGIEAFYFRDPEGHPLELIHFPLGKGRPQWQDAGGDLFQGVDHTAIVIAAAAKSTGFYSNLAQLQKTAVAHNYGTEQSRLSGLEGADLHATSLGNELTRAPSLELLEYVEPIDGRPMLDDTGPGDAWWSATLFAHERGSDGTNGDTRRELPELIDPDGYRVMLL